MSIQPAVDAAAEQVRRMQKFGVNDSILEGLTQAYWHASSQTERESIGNAQHEITRLRASQFRWISVKEKNPFAGPHDSLVYAGGQPATHWGVLPPLPEKTQEEKDDVLWREFAATPAAINRIPKEAFLAGLKAAREQKQTWGNLTGNLG